jgi:long-chain acyl-CoA synthetase
MPDYMMSNFDWRPSSAIYRVADHDAEAQSNVGHCLYLLRELIRAQVSVGVSGSGVFKVDAVSEVTQASARYLHCETSGSSGRPKVVRRTQASWIESFEINRPSLNLCAQDCAVVFSSVHNSLALYGVLEAAHVGAVVMSLRGVRPDKQLNEIDRAGGSILYITPTQLGLMCVAFLDHSPVLSVRHILVGGGQLSQGVRDKAAEVFPNSTLTHFYGAAETSFIAWSDATTPPGSVGRAYPNVVISIRDPAGNETPKDGEIWVKSPYLFEGYASGESGDTQWDDGFLSIGEFGRLDMDGNLFVAGRKSRMVTIADHNVFPEEIEAFLAARVDADHVAVVPRPDAKRGNQLVAVIAGADAATSVDELLRACHQGLGPLKSPKEIRLVPEIPLLVGGKLDYLTISQWAERET